MYSRSIASVSSVSGKADVNANFMRTAPVVTVIVANKGSTDKSLYPQGVQQIYWIGR